MTFTLPAGSSTAANIKVKQAGTLHLRASASRLTYTVAEPVVITVEAFRSRLPVSGANITANIYPQEARQSSQTIALLDDGVSPDIQAGDGLYTGQISGLLPGYYRTDTVFQHGASKRKSATNFEVIPVMGAITDNVTDVGVDTNADGLFERIDVSFEVDIAVAGTYSLLAELKWGTKSLTQGIRVIFPVGLSVQALSFSTKDIKGRLNSDGPYVINDVRLLKAGSVEVGERTRLIHLRNDLGFTQPYQLPQFQRPLTILLDGVTESVQDTNGNGKFDTLTIEFQADILRAGNYIWNGVLLSTDGNMLVSASNRAALNKTGIVNLSLDFDGKAINSTGVDGPYGVGNIGIYGPPDAAALRLEMGKTSGYTCDQFEGLDGRC